MKQVGIIGAGAAGLCSLHRIIESGQEYAPVVWEHSCEVGGTWAFTMETGKDRYGYPIHSSMYGSLRTNIPKEVMGFSDFPFKAGGKSFVHHTEVLQYLNEYADYHSLRPWIKFQHHVDSIEIIEGEKGVVRWEVIVKNLAEGSSSSVVCDAIIVCNGHYSVPKMPEIKDIKTFYGSVTHSHDYRSSDPYKNRTVAILGASASGLDISLEIAKTAHKVYLSHNFPRPIPSNLPSNMTQVKGIKEAKEKRFILMDESEIEVDDLILCTGYQFTFPFLNKSCGIIVEDNQVKTLYKHIVNTTYPTMAFIGITYQVLPFPVFDLQVQFFLKTLSGDLALPCKAEMDEDTRAEYDSKIAQGIPARHLHRMGNQQWEYIRILQDTADLKPLPRAIEAMYRDARTRRLIALTTYKDTEYSLFAESSLQTDSSHLSQFL